ncbi:hypothetical protein C6T66_10135 [Burkholderia multivorans]|nr:hypothetical protein BURMUCGD1_2477 [Burkholderia multivorans CGD1]PRG88405.1 hypothetical protein C6T66_10135 [Burkholderia multivorans]
MADGAGRTGCTCNGRWGCGHGCLRFVVGAAARVRSDEGPPARPSDGCGEGVARRRADVVRRSRRETDSRRRPVPAWSARLPGAARGRRAA